jgi:hypothetical protein
MSISYEDALATLQAMFGPPWNRELLDAVLRHQQGHMENTVDLVLRHSDKDPHKLVEDLKAGIDPDKQKISMDEQLARQLQQAARTTSSTEGGASGGSNRGRGALTYLPPDFLRIPNGTPVASNSSTSVEQLQSDEALARMLQDEMFSSQVSRNPQLSHLATGRSAATFPGQAQRRNDGANNQPDIMQKVSELGNNARKHLQLLAAQFNANLNRVNNNSGSTTAANDSTSGVAASERRGLLDDADDDAMELPARRD